MKTKSAIILLIVFSFSCIAQGEVSLIEEKGVIKNDTIKIPELKGIKDTLNLVLKKLNLIAKKDSTEKVGVFSIITKSVNIGLNNTETSKEEIEVNNIISNILKPTEKNKETFEAQLAYYVKNKITKLIAKKDEVLEKLKKTELQESEKEEYEIEYSNIIEKINKIKAQRKDSLYKELGVFDREAFEKLREATWKVHEIDLHIEDGMIVDILVTLKKNEEKRYFTNRSSISLLRYYSYEGFELEEEGKEKNTIKLYDVLRYEAKRGRNFAPNDQEISLDLENLSKPVEFNNSLNALLEYRIYSDFLGLIGEAPNGIVSLEAFSDIILLPKNDKRTHWAKMLTPFVTYSRIDSVKRRVIVDDDKKINNKISLVQKAFLKTGANFRLFEAKFAKEHPFYIYIPLKLGVNLSETSIPNKNITTITYGGAVGFSVRKIHNFGFDFIFGFDYYNPRKNHKNSIETSNFWTYGVNAELDYYDSEDKTSAFFLRLGSQRVLNGNDIFTSFQFGYKASISFASKKKE